jgi:hypothetical protein
LGLAFVAPLFQDSVGRAIFEEIDHGVSDVAIQNLLTISKAHIAEAAVTASVGISTSVGFGLAAKFHPVIDASVAAIIASILGLGGIGVSVYLLNNQDSAEQLVSQEQITTPPDANIEFSVPRTQQNDDATNPLDARLKLRSNEKLGIWTLADATGTILATGAGDYVEIAPLGLMDGNYRLTWHVTNVRGVGSEISFDFAILRAADDAGEGAGSGDAAE